MRKRSRNTALLGKRALSLLVAAVIALSMFAVVSIASASAQSTYYLDTSSNTDWNPATGESLCATFTTSGGSQTGGKFEFQNVKTNLYKVTGVPSDAAKIQIYLVRKNTKMLASIPADGKKRVFYNNASANWDTPYIYSWTGAGNSDTDRNHTWPGLPMTRIEGTTYWYYDTPFPNVIFDNGKDGNELVQTEDLVIEKENPVFAKATGSAWESAPYYKKYSTLTLGDKGNDIYAQKNDSLKLSKYSYSETDDDANPRSYTNTQVIYMYNPDWTNASNVKVVWDLNDPYNTTVTMEKLTDDNKPAGVFEGSVPNGFFKVTVPNDAKIQFKYGLATSNVTTVPTGQDNMCYNLKNSANIWCQLKDVLGEATDFLVPVESGTGNNSHDGTTFWTDAVYYDYLSDEELNYSSWLRPIKAGTKPTNVGSGYNFDGAEDDWFEFYTLNSRISSMAAGDSSWKYPLYFGNFCANWDAFLNDRNSPASRDTHSSAMNIGYFGPNATGLTRFDYVVNNSNGLKPNANQIDASNHIGVQGLSYSTSTDGQSSLSDDGNIQYAAGKTMPYFDAAWLKNQTVGQKPIGKTLRSSFPFYKSVSGSGSSQVTTYKFDSNPSSGQSDNVFFNWTGDKPDSVGYGRGTDYEVKDGYRNFMGDKDAGPGIFPFNNTTKTWGNRLNNSSNLDYGFGIKINMDFRVPKNGKLPNNEDVKFTYSGDDDLWVYISEYDDNGNLKNSRLALDLGGNHKQAKGEINFNTMKATATSGVVELKESDTYKRDRIYIEDVSNWGSVYVWAWNNTGDGKWYQAKRVGTSNVWYVSADQKDTTNNDRFDSKTMMAIVKDTNWSARAAGNLDGKPHETEDNDGTGRDTIANHWGKKTYTDNVNWIDQDSANALYTYTTDNKVTDFGFTPKRGTSYEQLDPTKTYHMTVFYMERGMIESNCSMSFTMTPARNDLKVKKIVETSDVNPGLENALKNQSFKFSNYETKVGATSGVNYITRYTLNNETSTRMISDAGYYDLKDQDVADFDNQYTTGSTMTVVEQERTPGVSYSTKWQVVDNAHGTKILPTGSDNYKNGRQTDGFVLKDSVIDTNTAKLQVNVVNTPSVQSLNLSKKVRNENDTADVANVDKEFKFKIKVDVDGGTNYQPYKLNYKVIADGDTSTLSTTDDGVFSFSAKDQVKIEGLPVGATYQIEELHTPGYAPLRFKLDNGNDSDFSGGVMSGTIGSSDSSIAFTNREKPISTKLYAKKYITDTDASNNTVKTVYMADEGINKELFSFTAYGLGKIKYDGTNESIDVSDTFKTRQPVAADGTITFGNHGSSDKFLNFTQEGVYLYKIVENGIIVDNNKTSNDALKTYKDDIGVSTQKYLVKVTVTVNSTSGDLEVLPDNIEYFTWDGNGPTAASFAASNKVDPSDVEFDNPIQKHGKCTIIKTDSQNSLDGVEFTLYKVDAENEAITPTTEVVGSQTTTNGRVEFGNLDIYKKTNGKYSGLMPYQWYAVKETTGKNGYKQDPSVYYFRLPKLENGATEPTYEVEFTYVNGALKSPSSGSVFSAVAPFGIALVILSMISMIFYFARQNRKPLKHARKRV